MVVVPFPEERKTCHVEYDTEGNRFIKRTDMGGIVTEIHDLSADYRVHADGSSEVHAIEVRNCYVSLRMFRAEMNRNPWEMMFWTRSQRRITGEPARTGVYFARIRLLECVLSLRIL